MSEFKYKKLFTPIKIGNLVLKNRIIAAPASILWIARDGSLTPETIAFYEQAAMGGAAVVTYGETIVHEATGKSHDRQTCIDDPQSLVSLSQYARAIHRHGAFASAELSHGGKFGGLSSLSGTQKVGRVAYGPSHEITPEGEVFEMPRELILEIIEAFGKGAATLKRIGYDMCMVHAGHGWLFSQFLSPKSNRRTDEFGGSFENRARLLVMALESIRRHAGADFPIEVRISGDEFADGGMTLEDSKRLVKLIEDKCDLINVSAGRHEGIDLFIRTHPTSYLPPGPNVYLAEEIRKEARVPISTVGGIVHPELMEEILETGKADIIELRRPLLADPYLPKKLLEGREDEIFKCVRCNNCFAESVRTGLISCTVNPAVGNEFNEWIARVQPVQKKKKVVVIGGGPGGMKAALTAAQRGHEVVLYEKQDKLGGTLQLFQYVDFKYDLYGFAQTLERVLRRSSVTIHTGTEATRETIRQENPDVLIIAAGANPIIPRIPGIDSEKFRLAASVFGNADELGENIIILGGGLVGCETAVYLGKKGKKVSIVEMREGIALDADIFEQTAIQNELRKYNVQLYCNATGDEINDEGLVITKDGEKRLLKADNVICAVGYKPNLDIFLDLAMEAPIVNTIGDCRKVGKVVNAVTDGYYIALDI